MIIFIKCSVPTAMYNEQIDSIKYFIINVSIFGFWLPVEFMVSLSSYMNLVIWIYLHPTIDVFSETET